jgi:hypothetical protein
MGPEEKMTLELEWLMYYAGEKNKMHTKVFVTKPKWDRPVRRQTTD